MVQELISYVVKQLVDNPDNVTVTLKTEDNRTSAEIAVHPDDRGKVIGREGQTIKAIRTLVTSLMPSDKRIFVDLVS